jgi:hypothetical protein
MSARIQYVDDLGGERYGWLPRWYRGLDPTRYDEECAAWRKVQRELQRSEGNETLRQLLNEIAAPLDRTWFARIEDPERVKRTLRVRIE